MKKINMLSLVTSLAAAILVATAGCQSPAGGIGNAGSDVEAWVTHADGSLMFEPAPVVIAADTISAQLIEIDASRTFQEIDGFGYTLTGGSAIHLNQMNQESRTALLRELFGTEGKNIGISYLRLSIGASDLSDHVFSYNDLPAGQTDPEMKQFSLEPERKDLLPVLKEILKIEPNIKILGSPWSPPTWMKTNNDTRGGKLKPEYYDAYALYLLRYIQEMQKEGITIDAITIQNEPLHPGNNPSLLMLAEEQNEFIKRSLGPLFKKNQIKTKIILYDHNADRPDYPITILNDAETRQYVDGSAFHLYGGTIDALSKVHEAYPDKNIYFTEQWVGAPGNFAEDMPWHVRTLTIGATKNWSKTVLEWNLSSNPELTPFTDRGGCSKCLGAITIDGNKVTRNPAYYSIAHASKFVRPGSVRIFSTDHPIIANVAFKTPEGKTVLIIQNNSSSQQVFTVKEKEKIFNVKLEQNAAATLIWD